MLRRLIPIAVLMSFVAISIPATTDRQAVDLTVHEWGTFTSVAGEDGHAVDWLALGGRSDLPCFVERDKNVGWINKLTLMAKVRMETPVLYFYSPHETSVTAKVRFPQGILTEWYPRASHHEFHFSKVSGEVTALEWNDVKVLPEANPTFPSEDRASHYYTARNTDAAPLRMKGQDEKFLFYRGVGSFEPPISVRLLPDGKVAIQNLGEDAIPFAVLFENRGGKAAFRDLRNLTGTVTVGPLNHDVNALWVRDTLAKILVTSGLYGREAAAMVDTWRDSWFEEGMRVFYIVPPRAVDSILPLEIKPKPAEIVRAFVGRMEIITPEMENAVAAAIRANDETKLETYGRFIAPIADRLLKERLSSEDHDAVQAYVRRATAKVFSATSSCK